MCVYVYWCRHFNLCVFVVLRSTPSKPLTSFCFASTSLFLCVVYFFNFIPSALNFYSSYCLTHSQGGALVIKLMALAGCVGGCKSTYFHIFKWQSSIDLTTSDRRKPFRYSCSFALYDTIQLSYCCRRDGRGAQLYITLIYLHSCDHQKVRKEVD